MIASQGVSTGRTCMSNPKPNRNVQLMTEVKCGTHANPRGDLALNKSRIRGTLRYDTTECITSKTHKVRTACASLIAITGGDTGISRFFYDPRLLGLVHQFFSLAQLFFLYAVFRIFCTALFQRPLRRPLFSTRHGFVSILIFGAWCCAMSAVT